jgi:prepilin-type N-terminal cleavage/methylation domain-containing protein
MSYKLKNKAKGFTIVEVMIVLAIAGLIMLIVFLAVPALQRNSRNTARRNDASRIAAAVNNYVANNNGQQPVATTDIDSIIADVGTMSAMGTLTSRGSGTVACVAGDLVATRFTTCRGAAVTLTVPAANAGDAVTLGISATCGTGVGVMAATGAGTGNKALSKVTGSKPEPVFLC